ncbi:MAG TPA: NUDIX domain-containing protein [Flavisolibacter sp.]|nr:NUDIX domain-containing protein [Flavisolibacter sp.]
MVKIYVRNKPLYLVSQVNGETEDYVHRPDTIFIDELNASAVKTMLQQLERDEYYQGVFLYEDVAAALEGFKHQLTVIQAAGGLVYTQDQKVLLIFRRGKWDMPKGKLDEGEDLETCAIREISEETGLQTLTLESPLQVTYHTYFEGEKHILKESHWYLVKGSEKEALAPQTDEDIERCKWVPFDQLETYKGNMHASIIDVLNAASKAFSSPQA